MTEPNDKLSHIQSILPRNLGDKVKQRKPLSPMTKPC